ncbi:MAG: GntR family transcriptional regulator [Mycobacterium sp.]|nr:GntR family transcriptional regulator [Mycobacterium sp.]
MTWDADDLVPGPVPLWFQISERLQVSLEAGEFGVGDALPSEAELGRRFSVSRTTARTALGSLAKRGLIEQKSGRGSIVLPRRVEQPLNLLSSFTEDMRARGLKPGYRDVQVDTARPPAQAAVELGLDDEQSVVRIRRVLLADEAPIAVSESWLSPRVLRAEGQLPEGRHIASLYLWLEREHGLRVTTGRELIEAGVADAQLATRLETASGSAVLVASRTAYDHEGVPLEYAIRHYRADRYRYRIELSRP